MILSLSVKCTLFHRIEKSIKKMMYINIANIACIYVIINVHIVTNHKDTFCVNNKL